MKEYALGLYEKSMPSELSLAEKLGLAGQAGFDYLEISIDETDEKLARLQWDAAKRQDLQRAVAQTGIPILSMCLSGHRRYPLGSTDEAVNTRSIEIMKDAINFAQDVGIRIIQIAGYDEYYQPSTTETIRRFGENLVKMTEYAASRGVILAFETMETPFMNSVAKAMSYVRQVDSPYLQVYPDIGNVTNSAVAEDRSWTEDLKSGTGHLVALHLKETVPGMFREIPYGTGHVDFPAACRLALTMGVRMFVGEFWYTGSPRWKEDLVSAGRFLRSQFPESL